MKTKNFNYELIKSDYEILGNEDDWMYSLKEAISKLTDIERKIFITYTELGSYAATARQFNVSSPTVKTYINKVKEKILYYVNND